MGSWRARPLSILGGVLFAGQALAWTPAVEVSAPSNHERSTPRITRGADGRLYVVYVNKNASLWEVHFREKLSGAWGPVTQISTPAFSVRPDILEVGGRPHAVFAVKNPSAYDLYHTVRENGAWTGSFVSTTSDFEDQPRLAADGIQRLHMVYTRGSVESSAGDVMYRIWTPSLPCPPCGSWSGETSLGQVTNAFYHRPDILIDAAGSVHVVWIQTSGANYKVRYRKNTLGVWGATIDVGSGAIAAHFFNHPRIATAGSNNIVVVWHDDAAGGGSNIHWNYSNNAGTSWAFGLSGSDQGQVLHAGHYPHLESGVASVHLVTNQHPDEKTLLYRRWTGGGLATWTASEPISTSNFWIGWPDVAEDASGGVHVVWDDQYGSDTTNHFIAYSSDQPDTVHPGPLIGFTATAFPKMVRLIWTNPADEDFAGVRICWSTSPLLENPECPPEFRIQMPGARNASQGVDHIHLTNGQTYHYWAFAYDTSNLYSSGSFASATPYLLMDENRDLDVDQSDFGVFQNCLGSPVLPGCDWADFNDDNIVNAVDTARFIDCWSGADIPYNPACAD